MFAPNGTTRFCSLRTGGECSVTLCYWTCPRERGTIGAYQTGRGVTMGDKSPKSKERSKKQDTAGKDQRRAAIAAKASLSAASSGKKPK
jgi:hypothetical protein